MIEAAMMALIRQICLSSLISANVGRRLTGAAFSDLSLFFKLKLKVRRVEKNANAEISVSFSVH